MTGSPANGAARALLLLAVLCVARETPPGSCAPPRSALLRAGGAAGLLLRLRGGVELPWQTVVGEGLEGVPSSLGGPSTHERIMTLIHENATLSLNMTVNRLLMHPSMRGRQVEPRIIQGCIEDYWSAGWQEQLSMVDRCLSATFCTLHGQALCGCGRGGA
jgi:hypothetical protein